MDDTQAGAPAVPVYEDTYVRAQAHQADRDMECATGHLGELVRQLPAEQAGQVSGIIGALAVVRDQLSRVNL